MRVGSVKEIIDNEFRVGLTPADVIQYTNHGHEVVLERGLGETSGFEDEDYEEAGAIFYEDAESVWAAADMIIKVKEPQPSEYPLMREGQIIYTYLHLAANPELTEAMVNQGVTGFAYETVTDAQGRLPLLSPMSQIAGRLSVFAGARALEKPMGGSGVLLSGVPGVRSANVLILGAGVVGSNAAIVAQGIGANVTIMDVNLQRLADLDYQYNSQMPTVFSEEAAIDQYIEDSDLVISTVLIPGARAPKLVKREHLKKMRPGSVIVDVAIDQGGSTEMSRATTHSNPTYVEEGIVMYCVSNMPGAVPFTSSKALANATVRYGLQIADNGAAVVKKNPGLLSGLNTYKGYVTSDAVAQSLDMEYRNPMDLLD